MWLRPPLCALLAAAGLLQPASAATFAAGDSVRLKRSETLLFKGENFLGAPKGQEFEVVQNDPLHQAVYVAFAKPDGTLIAVTLPNDALEATPPDGWKDLRRGAQSFRDGHYDSCRAWLQRATQDAKHRPLASALGLRLQGAIAASSAAAANLPVVLAGLRETAAQLCQQGQLSLGLALDEGTDRLARGLPGVPVPSKIDQSAVRQKVTAAERAFIGARQAAALHRLTEAAKFLRIALESEPNRPDAQALDARVRKDLSEAGDRADDADRMRKFAGGEVHALTALERGLKLCVDHPHLLELKHAMLDALESRTAPPVTPALLAAARSTSPAPPLEEGRRIYTTRCTECHDLEMVDSRSASGWQSIVSSMARRAHVDEAQQKRILEYLSVARAAVAEAN